MKDQGKGCAVYGAWIMFLLAAVLIGVMLIGVADTTGALADVQSVFANGFVVDGDEGVFTLIGAVIVIASLGLLKSTSKKTLTQSERYCQFGKLPASTAERNYLS